MIGRDHQITSCAIVTGGMIFLQNTAMASPLTGAALVGATAIGALLPDVDHPNSKISHWIKVPIYKLFNHRGVTHSWLGIGLFWGLTYWPMAHFFIHDWGAIPQMHVTYCLWLGLVLGYFLHVVEDSWSIDGVRWLAPFSHYDTWTKSHYDRVVRRVNHWKKLPNGRHVPIRHWWGRGYKVGSGEENALVGAIILLNVGLILWQVLQ